MAGPVVNPLAAVVVQKHIDRSTELRHEAASLARLAHPDPDNAMRGAFEKMTESLMFMQMAVEILLSESENYS
jgi:hypothetical protein